MREMLGRMGLITDRTSVWDVLWAAGAQYWPGRRRVGAHRIEEARVWAGDLIERLEFERRAAERSPRRRLATA